MQCEKNLMLHLVPITKVQKKIGDTLIGIAYFLFLMSINFYAYFFFVGNMQAASTIIFHSCDK